MKTYKHLFEEVCSFENLLKASKNAQKGKRFTAGVLTFNYQLESNLLALRDELLTETYIPGDYRTFYIFDPKHRKISAAPYRDRVVHHAVCNILVPIWDRQMIDDNYACRKGKGSHKAIERFHQFARRYGYVLKCDIRKFFDSIDHAALKQLLFRQLRDTRLNRLLDKIIESTQVPIGLPLGNLTSQWFANMYLNHFDHYIKETLRCKGYIRYMDDFVVFSDSKDELREIKAKIADYLRQIHLSLHDRKCKTWPVINGVNFLGFKVYPTHRVLLKRNVHRVKRRFAYFQRVFKAGTILTETIRVSVASWLGHLKWGDTYRLKQNLLERFVLSRE